MLFYFTGTGNSLYVAKQIETAPLSIPQVMQSASLNFSAEQIGVVAPIYGHEVPPMVKDFLRKARFHTDYFYMVLTYGNRHGGAAELAFQLCESCGIHSKYINVIMMVDNWLPSFDMDEQIRLDKKVEEHLAEIASDIHNRREMIAPVTDTDRAAHMQFLAGMKNLPPDAWQHLLRVTDTCTGCGLCAKVCPSASVRIEDGRAVHIPLLSISRCTDINLSHARFHCLLRIPIPPVLRPLRPSVIAWISQMPVHFPLEHRLKYRSNCMIGEGAYIKHA